MKGLKLLFLALMVSLQIFVQTISITAHGAFIDNENVLGVFSGIENISQELEPGEALVYAAKEVKDYPQIVGTDRHIMWGMFEIQNEQWEQQSCKCYINADVIESETMNAMIHLPEGKPLTVKKITTKNVRSSHSVDGNLFTISLLSNSRDVDTKVMVEF